MFLSKIQENTNLQSFGLQILVEGSVVERDTWTSNFNAIVFTLNPPVVVSIPDPLGPGDITSHPDEAVHIPDPNLRVSLARMLGQHPDEPITVSQMEQFSDISHRGHTRNGVYVEGQTLEGKGIRDLTGLEFAINLKILSLKRNEISKLTPLSRLTKLEYLDIGDNNVSNLSPITNLTNIKQLNLGDTNPITDLSPIANLHNIEVISIGKVVLLKDISVLAGMENLREVLMWGSTIQRYVSVGKSSQY